MNRTITSIYFIFLFLFGGLWVLLMYITWPILKTFNKTSFAQKDVDGLIVFWTHAIDLPHRVHRIKKCVAIGSIILFDGFVWWNIRKPQTAIKNLLVTKFQQWEKYLAIDLLKLMKPHRKSGKWISKEECSIEKWTLRSIQDVRAKRENRVIER